jgi:WD40 repeat protein
LIERSNVVSKFADMTRALALASLIVALSGCGRTAMPSNPMEQIRTSLPTYEPLSRKMAIVFMVRDESIVSQQSTGVVQIWKIDVDATVGWPLIELPIRYPVSALPPQESAILEHNLCSVEQDHCSIEDVHLSYGLGDLRLSPNRLLLAWADGASWCPNTECYGFQRLVTWDMTRGESRTLLEIPNHIDLRATQQIGEIVWSPDNGQIGFIQTSNNKGWSRVRVIDVATKQVRDIAEGRAPLTWAPDGERLAFISYSWGDVKVTSRDGTDLVTFDGSWERVEDIDWSPDGSKMAITAVESYRQIARHSLFIADLATGDIAQVEILADELLDYTQPHWAPDGRLIGVNIRRRGEKGVSGLVIFDSEDETVKACLNVERYHPEWSWSDTGDAALVRLGSPNPAIPPAIPQRIGVFYWANDVLEQVSLPADVELGLDRWQLYLGEPAW